MLARAHQSLIWSRTRHTNAAQARVLPGGPGGLRRLGPRRRARRLDRAPTPEQGAHLSRSAIHSAPNVARVGANAISMPAPVRSKPRWAPSRVVPAAVTRTAFAATTRATVAIITELNRQISELETGLPPF